MSFQITAVASAAALFVGAGLGIAFEHHLSAKQYDKLVTRQLAEKDAAVKAAIKSVKAQADLAQASAVAEAAAQQKIVVHTKKVYEEVPIYVTPAQDARGCVTYGLVRVLDAAVTGRDPADLKLPAGKSDDACAPVAASDLARSVAGNYGTARQNAEQLDALIADITARVNLANGDHK